jgi:hypothetical protein
LEAPYPPEPTTEEINQLPVLTYENVMEDQKAFSLPLEPATLSPPASRISHRQKQSWTVHRQHFLRDLEIFGIPRATLAWSLSEKAAWNQTFLFFVVKHFQRAMAAGAFSEYPMKHHGHLITLGIFERWLRGRREEMAKKQTRSEAQIKEKKRKQRVNVSLLSVDRVGFICNFSRW